MAPPHQGADLDDDPGAAPPRGQQRRYVLSTPAREKRHRRRLHCLTTRVTLALRRDSATSLRSGRRPRPKVDQGHAWEVAARFLAAESRPQDPLIRAAYLALQRESDRAFMLLTEGISAPVRVAFSRCTTSYASDRELIAAVRGERVLEVTTSAIERDRPHPLLDNDQGGAYDRFRASTTSSATPPPRSGSTGTASSARGWPRSGSTARWLAPPSPQSSTASTACAGPQASSPTTRQRSSMHPSSPRARPGVPIFNGRRSWPGAGGSRSLGSTHGCGR
jgi:hypothetical protein